MVYALTVVVELVSVDALPRLVAAFEPLHAVSNDPAREPGCLSYELLRANDDPKTVIILERFADQSAHKDVHRNSGPFQAFSVWLRGEAQRDDLPGGRIVASVNGRHFVSSGECVAMDGSKVEIPVEIKRLSCVERVVRNEVKAPADKSDPAGFQYAPVTGGILVFGGARNGTNEDFVKVAANVGTAIGRSKRVMVYGGGTVGVMGAAARAALDAGSHVIGIIPEALFPRELSGECIGTVVVTQDMNERKRVMFAASSAIVCLPGGVGTLDELFEAITLIQLNACHAKIILVNVHGFYEPLVALLQSQVAAGFVDKSVFNYFTVHSGDGSDVVEKLDAMPLAEPAAKLNWKKE